MWATPLLALAIFASTQSGAEILDAKATVVTLKKGEWTKVKSLDIKFVHAKNIEFKMGETTRSRVEYLYQAKLGGEVSSHSWSEGFPGGQTIPGFRIKVDHGTYLLVTQQSADPSFAKVEVSKVFELAEYSKTTQLIVDKPVDFPDVTLELNSIVVGEQIYSEEQIEGFIQLQKKEYIKLETKVDESIFDSLRDAYRKQKKVYFQVEATYKNKKLVIAINSMETQEIPFSFEDLKFTMRQDINVPRDPNTAPTFLPLIVSKKNR